MVLEHIIGLGALYLACWIGNRIIDTHEHWIAEHVPFLAWLGVVEEAPTVTYVKAKSRTVKRDEDDEDDDK